MAEDEIEAAARASRNRREPPTDVECVHAECDNHRGEIRVIAAPGVTRGKIESISQHGLFIPLPIP